MHFWKHPPWIPSCASCPLVIALQGWNHRTADYSFLRARIDSVPCFLFVACLLDTQTNRQTPQCRYWGGNEHKHMYACSFIYILLSITPISRVSSIARRTIVLVHLGLVLNKDGNELVHVKLKCLSPFSQSLLVFFQIFTTTRCILAEFPVYQTPLT